MNQIPRISRFVVFACTALGLSSAAAPRLEAVPPNWKVSATGTATLADFDGTYRTDRDAFGGHSSHLGKFTATGYHVLNVFTGEFAGVATYSAANGDTLNVSYAGQLFPSGDADFP